MIVSLENVFHCKEEHCTVVTAKAGNIKHVLQFHLVCKNCKKKSFNKLSWEFLFWNDSVRALKSSPIQSAKLQLLKRNRFSLIGFALILFWQKIDIFGKVFLVFKRFNFNFVCTGLFEMCTIKNCKDFHPDKLLFLIKHNVLNQVNF